MGNRELKILCEARDIVDQMKTAKGKEVTEWFDKLIEKLFKEEKNET